MPAVTSPAAVSLAALAFTGMLAGCSTAAINPVDWWHQLQGGPLATTRPPPPKDDAPYPMIGQVPAKPTPPDPGTRIRISSGLVADRANAQYTASRSPLRASSPGAPPAPPRGAASNDDTSSATLQAANAPPPGRIAPLGPPQPPLPNVTPAPPRPAPVGGVTATPLPPLTPPPDASVASAPPAAATAVPEQQVAGQGGSDLLPGMPAQPPPMVQLSGTTLPTTVAPAPPPATPVAPPPPVAIPQPGQPITIAFPPGSAVLPTTALAPLKLLAQRHGAADIAVTGYGEAPSVDPDVLSAALGLALARARSIAADLLAAGVPSSAIRIGAQARGAGGAAQIVSD